MYDMKKKKLSNLVKSAKSVDSFYHGDDQSVREIENNQSVRENENIQSVKDDLSLKDENLKSLKDESLKQLNENFESEISESENQEIISSVESLQSVRSD